MKVKSESEVAQSCPTPSEADSGFFEGGDAREYPGGLLRLDPAFAYAEPPSSSLPIQFVCVKCPFFSKIIVTFVLLISSFKSIKI